MQEYMSYHPEWATQLQQEIVNDTSDWFHPRGRVTDGEGIGDFDYGRMRFVNRNLNYFYFDNMLSHAVKNQFDFNPKYPKFLEFSITIADPNEFFKSSTVLSELLLSTTKTSYLLISKLFKQFSMISALLKVTIIMVNSLLFILASRVIIFIESAESNQIT